MRSPVMSHRMMEKVSLLEGLVAYTCPESGGIFLPVAQYFCWLMKQPRRLEHLPEGDDAAVSSVESDEAKICPESGQIMQRFRVGHGFRFHIERSPSGSVWLDGGEWEALRGRNFHDELHLVFTAPWQAGVRATRREELELSLLRERLGADLFDKVVALKSQLEGHEYASQARAFLHN